MILRIKGMIINLNNVKYIKHEYNASFERNHIKIYFLEEQCRIVDYYETYEECEKELEKIMQRITVALKAKSSLCFLKIDNLIVNTKYIKFIEKGSWSILGSSNNDVEYYITIHFIEGGNYTLRYTTEATQIIEFNKIL